VKTLGGRAIQALALLLLWTGLNYLEKLLPPVPDRVSRVAGTILIVAAAIYLGISRLSALWCADRNRCTEGNYPGATRKSSPLDDPCGAYGAIR
jgi:hypothetical protein